MSGFERHLTAYLLYNLKQAKTAKRNFMRQAKVMKSKSSGTREALKATILLDQIVAVSITDPHAIQLSSVVSPSGILHTHSILFLPPLSPM